MITGFRQVFAEVAQQVLVEAGLFFGVGENLLQAVEILFLATEEELLEAPGEGGQVARLPETAVGVTNAAWFEGDIGVGFQGGKLLDDAVPVAVELLRGSGRIDRDPGAAVFSGGEEVAQEPAVLFVVTEDGLFQVAQKLDPVGGVKRCGGNDVSFQFEVGEEGVDDEGADVVRASQFVV